MSKCRLRLNNGKIYGREGEINVMKQVFNEALDGSAECVFIEGASGIGKTTLIDKAFSDQSCIFARGKFEKQGTGQYPFAAIISVLREMIDDICEDEDLREEVAAVIESEWATTETSTLTRFLPEFEDLFESNSDSDSDASSTPSYSDRRDSLGTTSIAIRDFMRVVTQEAEYPVVICLDDLQWADMHTLNLIEYIANDEEQGNFLFIGTYRPNEIPESHPLRRWKNHALDPAYEDTMNPLTIIGLKSLSIIHINQLLSDVTHLDEGQTFPLATLVMTRTNGNAFFVVQLLEHLQNIGLMRYDLGTFKWTWDLERVRGVSLTDHVVDLVINRIQRHPRDVQRVLQLAACVGFRVDESILEVAKHALAGDLPNIQENLEYCIKERLMERLQKGRYKFFHDKIRQAALSLTSEGDEFAKLHFRIGGRLWSYINRLSRGGQKVEDRLLFLCADQLSLGSDYIVDAPMKLKLAQLANMVGRKAIELSAFATAADYFEKGMELLDDLGDKWNRFRDLCMSMHVSYAEVQYYVGHFDASLEAIEDVKQHGPSLHDQIRVNLTRLFLLRSECRLAEFVASSVSFLEEFGEVLPKDPNKTAVKTEFARVYKMFQGYTDEEILSIPHLKDPTKTVIIKVLNSMVTPLDILGMHNLAAMVIMRVVRLSIAHGITELSPETFAMFGALLISDKEDIKDGYRYGELALQMSIKLDPARVDTRVVNWVYLCTRPWQLTPLSQSVEKIFEGHAAAMKYGDPYAAFRAIDAYLSVSFYSSLDLYPLLRDIEGFSDQILEYGQKMVFLQILPLWQCVLNLSGRGDNPLNMMQGDAMDRQSDVCNKKTGKVQKEWCWSYLMQIAFYMGDLELATEMSSNLQRVQMGISKSHCQYLAHVFFFGLIAIANARKTGKRKFKVDAAKHLLVMRRWVQEKAANAGHKLMILEAEYETLTSGSGDVLQPKYDKAIARAKKTGYIQDAALAAQLAGQTLMITEDFQHYADTYILKAQNLWKTWGAFAVALKVKKDFSEVFTRESSMKVGEKGNFLSRERFDRRISLEHQRRLSETEE